MAAHVPAADPAPADAVDVYCDDCDLDVTAPVLGTDADELVVQCPSCGVGLSISIEAAEAAWRADRARRRAAARRARHRVGRG
ncbi:hypothetical protein [Microbacterium sp. gxy059]|uniref:hypothetical protein n=1 Tax=Microbacterium sp. gxy059 TaxID=2957199 RepID=UPI003D99A898